LSSSVQDAPAQGSTEWEPMLFKTVAMTTSMDDMSDDGFVAEASRWIVQNCGSLSTIVHAALLCVLPDSDLPDAVY